MSTDVLIAGAGPAGAIAATVLARAGARVLVLDRARFPRHKLCGDTLNPGALALLKRLGLHAATGGSLPLSGMIVTGTDGVRVLGRYDGVCGVAAPVLDAAGVARFAIGIQGPSVRLTDSRVAELGPLLVRTAREVADLVLAAR